MLLAPIVSFSVIVTIPDYTAQLSMGEEQRIKCVLKYHIAICTCTTYWDICI